MTEQDFTTEGLQNEIWKPFPHFPDLYHISSLGRVKRLAGTSRTPIDRLLQIRRNKYGYYETALTAEKKFLHYTIHKLVALTFLGECPEGYEINHIDGKKNNNRASNLEYVTHAENMQHAYANGLYKTRTSRSSQTQPLPTKIHVLSNVNVEQRTADCRNCGKVKIHKKGKRNRCAEALREHKQKKRLEFKH